MILIKVFDEQHNFNNAIVPLSLDIDRIIFIFHHQIKTNKYSSCKKIINKYKNIPISFIYASKDDLENYFKEDIIVDVSAQRYLSLVLYEKAIKYNKDIIYFDEEEKCIKDYQRHKIIASLFKINIEDMIILNGGKINKALHNPVTNVNSIKKIKETIIYAKDNYQDFLSFVSKINTLIINRKNYNNSYLLDDNVMAQINNDKNYQRFKSLDLFKINNNKLIFYNNEIRKLFMVSGTFLENYIYQELNSSNIFDDVLMSANIDFSKNRNIDVRCEVDCLAIKDNCLLFISIKSNKVDTDDLNEIKVHNIMFGNEYSKPVICINNELSENRPNIYAKAKELGIYIIEKDDLEFNLAYKFLSIINDTYKYNDNRWQP